MKSKINFRFNGGLGAILCNSCSVIIKTGKDFTEDEWKSARGEIPLLPAQYCDKCKQK